MRWSFARALLRTESFFGVVAVVIAVSNAPIFQNVGVGDCDRLERWLLVSFYISLIAALLALFVGKIAFEAHCPNLIKRFGTHEDYVAGMPEETDEDRVVRFDMVTAWRTANASSEKILLIRAAVSLFLFLFPLAFCLAILTLLEFAAW